MSKTRSIEIRVGEGIGLTAMVTYNCTVSLVATANPEEMVIFDGSPEAVKAFAAVLNTLADEAKDQRI